MGHQLPVHVNLTNMNPPHNPPVAVHRDFHYASLLPIGQCRKRLLGFCAERLPLLGRVDIGQAKPHTVRRMSIMDRYVQRVAIDDLDDSALMNGPGGRPGQFGPTQVGISQVSMSYGQIWCMPMNSSGDLVGFLNLFSVNKFHTCNDLCQVCEAA